MKKPSRAPRTESNAGSGSRPWHGLRGRTRAAAVPGRAGLGDGSSIPGVPATPQRVGLVRNEILGIAAGCWSLVPAQQGWPALS